MTENLLSYPFEIQPLTQEDGGGYLISYPDFNECISDGETVEDAIHNGLSALKATIYTLESMGFPIPKPFSRGQNSSLYSQSISESLHQRLEAVAQQRNIPVDRLINSILEESLR